jgi:hypothetical protein
MDYIELPQGTDVARLQTLLDDWCARVARKPI